MILVLDRVLERVGFDRMVERGAAVVGSVIVAVGGQGSRTLRGR